MFSHDYAPGGTSSFHGWIKGGVHRRLRVPAQGKELNLFSDKLSEWLSVDEERLARDANDHRDSDTVYHRVYLPPDVSTLDDLLSWYLRRWKGNCEMGSDLLPNDVAIGEVWMYTWKKIISIKYSHLNASNTATRSHPTTWHTHTPQNAHICLHQMHALLSCFETPSNAPSPHST